MAQEALIEAPLCPPPVIDGRALASLQFEEPAVVLPSPYSEPTIYTFTDHGILNDGTAIDWGTYTHAIRSLYASSHADDQSLTSIFLPAYNGTDEAITAACVPYSRNSNSPAYCS